MAGKLGSRRRGRLGLDAVELRSARVDFGWLRGWHQERENDERDSAASLHVGIGGRWRRRVAEELGPFWVAETKRRESVVEGEEGKKRPKYKLLLSTTQNKEKSNI